MKTLCTALGSLALLVCGSGAMSQTPPAVQPDKSLTINYGEFCPQQPRCNVRPGNIPPVWYSGGPKCMEMQDWEAHEYNPDMVIVRQSGCTDYEQPFIFLMFGKERALLIDTGSRNVNIVPEMQAIIHRWLVRNHRTSIPLIIVHSHAHLDHTFGDGPLQSMHDPSIPVIFVAPTIDAQKKFFNITNWPDQLSSVDLGDRIVDVIPAPGHEPNAVVYYDRQTAILFTGDNIYPGRLFIQDLPTYKKSNERLLKFTADKPVAHILGNHIGQTHTPFLAYPMGAIYQPDPHELGLPREVMLEIEEGLEAMHGKPRRIAYRDFTLWPVDDPAIQKDKMATIDHNRSEQNEHMWDQYQR